MMLTPRSKMIGKVCSLAILLCLCALPALAASDRNQQHPESESSAVVVAAEGRELLAITDAANAMTTEDGTWDVRSANRHPSGDDDDGKGGKKGRKKSGDDDDDVSL